MTDSTFNRSRVLRFIVDDQILCPDSTCDFSNLAPGHRGYLVAEFAFSKEWDGCNKVAAFYSPLGREYPPRALGYGNACVIPFEALEKRSFKIQVIGKRGDILIKTNKLTVKQNGGKA